MNIFRQQFKGIVQPKMYILSLLTLKCFQTCMSSFLLFNTRKYIKKPIDFHSRKQYSGSQWVPSTEQHEDE